jgi:hypothetical protein
MTDGPAMKYGSEIWPNGDISSAAFPKIANNQSLASGIPFGHL